MQRFKFSAFIGLGVLSLVFILAPDSADAAIFSGDVIVIDIGRDGQETTGVDDPDGTWNNINESGAGSAANGFESLGTEFDGTVIADLDRYSDGTPTGVGLDLTTVKSGTGAFAGIGGAEVAAITTPFPTTGLIPTDAQRDVSFFNNGNVILTFTGLDDDLLYNLSFMSKIDIARNSNTWVANEGLASQQSIAVDPNDAPFVHTFFGLTTDGSGNITLEVETPDSGGADTAHLNALELTAIPEPASVALLGLAAVGLLRRRRNESMYCK